jgi:cell division protein FtsI/penicillin-binding protein 2
VAEPTLPPWRDIVRRRAVVAGVCVLLWTGAIESRLVYLQVVRHAEMAARAERQQLRTVTAPAKRGEIRDRNDRLLAYSVDVDSVYAVPAEIGDAAATAQALCRALDDCDRGKLKALVERFSSSRAFAYVERFVTPQVAARVTALDLEGVGLMKESRRYYPKKELGAQLIGYVGVDNVGLGGLEAAYDQVVRGRDGKVLVQTDARRRGFSSVERSPTAGGTLELTIDEQLQHIVERELKAGVTEHRADGGTAILMDPHTGEILAMATYPSFNPNAFRTAAELTSIMEDVVDHGTGTQARIDGFTVAGKSGTAGKIVAGAYSKSEYNVSFVGFVPSRKPVFTAIVVVDTPRAGKYYGGSVAAPVFRRIADAALRHMGVAPTVFPAPPVLVDRKAQSAGADGIPTVITVAAVDDGRSMPDLRGLSAREALRRLASRRLTARLQGQGLVVSQTPAPGTPLDAAAACTLVLDRHPKRLAQAMLTEVP